MKFAVLNPADAFLARKMCLAIQSPPHILGRDGMCDGIAVSSRVENVRVGETVGILLSEVGVVKWGTLAERWWFRWKVSLVSLMADRRKKWQGPRWSF